MNREANRRHEIENLVAQGRVPHEVELEEHPEKFVPGLVCM